MNQSTPSRVSFREIGRGRPEGRLVFSGRCPLADVKLQQVPSTLQLNDEQVALTGDVVDELRARGMVVTDDPIYRLEGWSFQQDLQLRVAPRSYFDSVLLKRYPEWGIRSQVIAVVAVTQCADGYLVEKRSDKVASLPGRLHPAPSGSIEPPGTPLETLRREASEELGIQPAELSQEMCLGLAYGERSGVYQLVCRATTELGYQEIASRECEGLWERAELLCAPDSEQAYFQWLSDREAILTSGGRLALFMEGARRWGSHWLEEALR